MRLNSRIISKHDTTANWNAATGFVPLKGEIIIYEDYEIIDGKVIPNLKIGDGSAYVQDLPFVDDGIRQEFLSHINNAAIHVTADNKIFWNDKINIDDSLESITGSLEDENLIFSRTYYTHN